MRQAHDWAALLRERLTSKDSIRLLGFFSGPAISALLSFILVPLTTWIVLPEELGRVSMFTMALSIGGLASYMGLDSAFAREFHAVPDRHRLFHQCVGLPLSIASVLCLVFLLGYGTFSRALWGEPSLAASLLLAACVMLTIIERLSSLAIRMEGRAWLYSGLMVLNQGVRLGLTLLLLHLLPRSYVTIMLATTIAMAVAAVARVISTREYWLATWRHTMQRAALERLLRFGLPLLPAGLLMWTLNSMDNLALRSWGTFSDLGVYSAGFKLVAAIEIVNQAFSTFWWPMCYRWYASGEPKARFDAVTKNLVTLVAVLALAIVLGRNLIVLLFGPEYREAAHLVPFLVFVPLMYLTSEVAGAGIALSRKTEYYLINTGVAAAANLLGNWLLVPRYGALGAAIATAISYTLFMVTKSLLGNWLWDKSLGSGRVYALTAVMLAVSFATLL